MANGPFRDLTLEEIYRISAKNRASRTHRLGDVVQDSRDDREVAKPPPGRSHGPPAQSGGILGVNLTLPWPPTVNHYWLPARNGRLYISAKGRSFRAQVKMLAHGVPLTAGAVAVTVIAHPPDRCRRDLDNILKACLDALQHAGLIEDDSNIADLRISRAETVKGGAVQVAIEGK